MKKLIILFVGLFLTAASIIPTIGGSSPETQTTRSEGITLSVQQTTDTTLLHYTIDAFTMTPVEINNKQYVTITLNGEAKNLNAGTPALPSIARSIIIPTEGNMILKVVASSYDEYTNILVAPSKGNLPRTVNPADVPYEFGEIYTQNTWYPATIAELQEPYYLRDFRGQVVTIYPFQYNPEQTTLRFYHDITVEITPTQPLSSHSQLTAIDNDFLSVYNHHFVNFNSAKYEPVSEQGNMLVITYDSFYATMVPFVQWKNLKGIPTEMVNVSTIGNAAAIKTFISDYYTTNGRPFRLLLGKNTKERRKRRIC